MSLPPVNTSAAVQSSADQPKKITLFDQKAPSLSRRRQRRGSVPTSVWQDASVKNHHIDPDSAPGSWQAKQNATVPQPIQRRGALDPAPTAAGILPDNKKGRRRRSVCALPSLAPEPSWDLLRPEGVDTGKNQELLKRANDELKHGRFEQAVAFYSQAINDDPTNAMHYAKRSFALHSMRNFKAALGDANHALGLCPADAAERPWVLVRRAQACEGLRQNKQAVECYKEALKSDPSCPLLQKKVETAKFRARADQYGYAGRGRVF